MKRYFFHYLVALLLVCLVQNAVAAEMTLFHVGAFQNYPLIFKDTDGEVKGLYVDLLSEIALQENIHFEYVFGSWYEGLSRIQTGEVDLLTSVGFTEERALFMDYGKKPLLTVWGELYTNQKSDINGILEIQGKKIGVLNGDINAENFKNLIIKFNIPCQYVEYSTYDEIFKAVSSNAIDAGIAGITFGAANQRRYRLKSTGVVFNPLNIYFTTKKNTNTHLLSILDRYLDKWKNQENSVFIQTELKWIYGVTDQKTVMPRWFLYTLLFSGIVSLIGIVFIVLLRMQVRKATKTIRIREEALKKSEDIFNQFMLHSPIYVFFKDDKIRSLKLSANYENLLGKPMNELIGKNMDDLFPSDFAKKMIEEDQSVIKNGKVITLEEEFNGKIYSTIKFPFELSDNKTYLAGFTVEITERKKNENQIKILLAEKEIILKEVHHRIKNNMNTIKGLLSLQIADETNSITAEALKDAESRVQTIMMLYDRLYFTDNYRELSIREYLKPLAEEIIRNFHSDTIVELVTDIDDYILNVQVLSPLGIIVNEILTNKMKHAFIGKTNGLIQINFSVKNARARLSIADNGSEMPESVNLENSKGFGLKLIRLLTEQIEGTIQIERKEGTTYILEFGV